MLSQANETTGELRPMRLLDLADAEASLVRLIEQQAEAASEGCQQRQWQPVQQPHEGEEEACHFSPSRAADDNRATPLFHRKTALPVVRDIAARQPPLAASLNFHTVRPPAMDPVSLRVGRGVRRGSKAGGRSCMGHEEAGEGDASPPL